MSGCDPIRDSLPTLTVAHPQFSQDGGRSACTSVIPTNPFLNKKSVFVDSNGECVLIVIIKSVRLRGRLFAAVLHGFEAQVIQPEKAGRKILGVRCKECSGKGAKRHAPCVIFFKISLCLSFRPRETTGLGAFRLNLSA